MESCNGIYIVVVILSIILAGIGYYLFRIDRKLSKLEKEKNSKD
jgi:CcmD family protein